MVGGEGWGGEEIAPSGTPVSPTHPLPKLHHCPWGSSACAQPAVQGRDMDHPLPDRCPSVSLRVGIRTEI